MDDLGFAPSSSITGAVKTAARRDGADMSRNVGRAASGQIAQRVELTAEDKTIQTLQGTERKAWWLFNIEIVGAMGATILGGLAAKLGFKRTAVAIKSFFTAPSATLRKTTLGEWHQAPRHFMEHVKGVAEEVATTTKTEKLADGTKKVTVEVARDSKAYPWIQKAENSARNLETGGKNFAANAGKHTKWFTKPIGNFFGAIGRQLGKIKWVNDASDRVSNLMHGHGTKGLDKSIDRLHGSLTTEHTGFFKGIGNKLGRTKPAPIHTPELGEVLGHVEKARGAATVAERASHLGNAKTALKAVSENQGLTDTVKKQIGRVVESLEHSHGLATTLEKHAGAASGFAGLMERAATRIKGTSLFTAALALGITAGVGAIALSTRKENRVAKQALKEMTDDIGDPNHPMVVAASKLHAKQGSRRWVAAGLNTTVQGITLGTLGSMGNMGSFAGVMAAQMGLMGLGQMIVPENMLLNAYASLKQAEQGKTKLTEEQHTFFVKQLVAGVPAVSKQGGQYNRLVGPIAEKIVEKHLNVRDTMRFLANQQEFIALATQVAETQKKAAEEALAAKQAAATTPAAGKPAETNITAQKTSPETAALTRAVAPAADKPTLSIAAAKDNYQGRLVDLQRAVGQPA